VLLGVEYFLAKANLKNKNARVRLGKYYGNLLGTVLQLLNYVIIYLFIYLLLYYYLLRTVFQNFKFKFFYFLAN